MIIEFANAKCIDLGPDFYNKVKLYVSRDWVGQKGPDQFSLVAFLLDADGLCRRPEDSLYWKNKSVGGLRHHQDDELRTYDCEGIYVKTREISDYVEKICFCITSEPFGRKLKGLPAVNVYVNPAVQYQFPLGRIYSFGAGSMMQVATLNRVGDRWKYINSAKKISGNFSTACSRFGVTL